MWCRWVVAALVMLVGSVSGAGALTLTFEPAEGFSGGAGRDAVNANPLLHDAGLTFDANRDHTGFGNGVQVKSDPRPGSPGGLVLSAQTDPDGADLLLTSASLAMTSISVDFVDVPDFAGYSVSLRIYDQTPTTLSGLGAPGVQPQPIASPNAILDTGAIAHLSWSGAPFRAVQFESNVNFVYIDNVVITFEGETAAGVPEPAAVWLGLLAAPAACAAARGGQRRRAAS